MENKYYTPTIEEFHVGFEYEVLAGTDWVNTQIHVENITLNMDRVINHIETCRVKCLNREDIESLGWDHNLDLPSRYEYKDYVLYNFNNSNIFTIKIKRSFVKYEQKFTDFDVLFEGTIKNKSELIKLMQQLNTK
jgi:hypothetical protein